MIWRMMGIPCQGALYRFETGECGLRVMVLARLIREGPSRGAEGAGQDKAPADFCTTDGGIWP